MSQIDDLPEATTLFWYKEDMTAHGNLVRLLFITRSVNSHFFYLFLNSSTKPRKYGIRKNAN